MKNEQQKPAGGMEQFWRKSRDVAAVTAGILLFVVPWAAFISGGVSLGANELNTSARNARKESNKIVKDNKEKK